MVKLIPNRDLIQDEFGNYYEIESINEGKVTLVNAAIYYSFTRIMNEHFLQEVKCRYKALVGAGQFFVDTLKDRIAMLTNDESSGRIYPLREIATEYEIEVIPIFESKVLTIK